MLEKTTFRMDEAEEKTGSSPTGDDNSVTTSNSRTRRSGEKYGLRPRTIIKRLQQERVRQEVPIKRSRSSKSRPAPLSKYRRKTANARERHRMKEINNAFDTLRKVLPEAMEIQAATTSCSMTKITTLRLAVNYIRALSEVLEDDSDMDICSIQSSLQDSIKNTIQESLQQSFVGGGAGGGGGGRVAGGVPSGHSMVLQYETQMPHFTHHYLPQFSQFPGLCSSSDVIESSSSSSHSTSRGSIGSNSDFEELLSDDSGLLEDNLDVFSDIPTLCITDPFDILLSTERDSLAFAGELCN